MEIDSTPNLDEVLQPPSPAPARAETGQQQFLTMLIAQLENQDPLEPQDPTEFTAQLAQFSILEELIAIRSAVERLSAEDADESASDAEADRADAGEEPSS